MEQGLLSRIVMTPSNHGCRRGLFDEDKALWGGWAVIGPKHKYILCERIRNLKSEKKNISCLYYYVRFWFGGDTAYSDVFEQIGRRLGPFDISAIPIGAYYPYWFMRFVHVDPEEAVRIHKDLRSSRSVAIHRGSLKMTTEFYLEPRERLRNELQRLEMDPEEFVAVNIGETVTLTNT